MFLHLFVRVGEATILGSDGLLLWDKCSLELLPLISILSSVNLRLIRDVPVRVLVMYKLKME